MIWKIWMKCEMIWKTWQKDKLNSEMICKLNSKKDMKNMEETQVE